SKARRRRRRSPSPCSETRVPSLSQQVLATAQGFLVDRVALRDAVDSVDERSAVPCEPMVLDQHLLDSLRHLQRVGRVTELCGYIPCEPARLSCSLNSPQSGTLNADYSREPREA